VNITAAVAALGINVGLNCVLIPRWGISGAAISTTVSYSVAALILLFMFVRESGHTVRQTVLVQSSEIAGYLRWAARVRGLDPGAAGK
jgi:Na+-driven multidrug efflux pump